jgi:hypothetical protein
MDISADLAGKFNNPFSALKHKNYRYFWVSMCISLIGTWMQNIAQPWLAYTPTGSPCSAESGWRATVYTHAFVLSFCGSCC